MVFLVQKWPFRDAHLFFKKRAWNPYFYSVFWVRVFWGQGVKKGKIWKATKKNGKIWPITEKLFFGIFAVFFGGFFFFFSVFFWRVKRSGEVAQRATSLGPKPSLFVFFGFVCFFLCFLFSFFLSFFGGFKGQVRWPEGPPHLALNPPYLFLFLFFLFIVFCF